MSIEGIWLAEDSCKVVTPIQLTMSKLQLLKTVITDAATQEIILHLYRKYWRR